MLFPALLTAGAARFVWRGVGSDGPLKEINRYHTGRSDVAGPAGYARIRNQKKARSRLTFISSVRGCLSAMDSSHGNRPVTLSAEVSIYDIFVDGYVEYQGVCVLVPPLGDRKTTASPKVVS